MPVWMYNKDGAKLFKDGETIPHDYVDHPDKVGKGVEKEDTQKKTRKKKDK